MIKIHIESVFLESKEGRSDKAAKQQPVTRESWQESAMTKLRTVDESFSSISGGHDWAERGEAGRWVRVHTHPRTSSVLPWKVPGGPGRKTRLTHERSTRGVNSQGRQFTNDDLWDEPTANPITMTPWTGRTIFMVDQIHSDHLGYRPAETANRRLKPQGFNVQ